MKHSICNIQLLPKAADLRNKAFDEFRLNGDCSVIASFTECNEILADFQFIPDPLVPRA